jgi:hypothetical protein
LKTTRLSWSRSACMSRNVDETNTRTLFIRGLPRRTH